MVGHHTQVQEENNTMEDNMYNDRINADFSAYTKIKKAWDTITTDTIIEMVHSNTNAYGKAVTLDVPTNIHSDNEEIASVYKQKHIMKKLLGVGRYTHFGLVRPIGELNVPSMDLEQIFDYDNGVNNIAAFEELYNVSLDKATLMRLASIYMLGQDRLNSINVRDNNLVIGKTVATRYEHPSIELGFFTWKLLDLNGVETALQAPMTFSVSDNLTADIVEEYCNILGVTIHDARHSIGSTKYGASTKGTNDAFTMTQVLPLNKKYFNTKSLGKILAKRNFTLAGRSFTALKYDCEFTETTWNFGNDVTMNVLIYKSEFDSGDGMAGYARPSGIGKLMAALGEDEEKGTKWAQKNHTFSANMLLADAYFDKGHIHICHDEEQWPFEDHIDIVVDKAALDMNTRLTISNRAAISLSPMKVKEDQIWVILNGKQLTPEAMKWIDDAQFQNFPNWFLNGIRETLQEALWELIVADEDIEEEEEEDNSFTGEKIATTKLENNGINLASKIIKNKKTGYYRAVRNAGIFGGPTTISKFCQNWFAKIKKMVEDYNEHKIASLLVPATRTRTTTPPYMPKNVATPESGSVQPIKRDGAKTPWSTAIDPALMKSETFQFRMEYLDHDDGIICIWLVDTFGQDHILMIKEPTSPNAGYAAPVSAEVAEQYGIHRLEMNTTTRRRTDSEILEELHNPKRLYQPTPLKETIDAVNPIDYAYKAAEVVNRLGSMPLLSNLMTLASRSRLWEDRTWAEWSYSMFIQASDAVDAQVAKTVTITRLIEQFMDAILAEVVNGKPLDGTYLFHEDCANLLNRLSRRYKKLYEFNYTWLKNDKLNPNTEGPWLQQYERIASIPARLKDPMQYNSAVLMAMVNGPMHMYQGLDGVTREVLEIARSAYIQINEANEERNWQVREANYEQIANSVMQQVSQLDDYELGSVTRVLVQLHASFDVAKLWDNGIDNKVPAPITKPVIEYFPQEELGAAYNKIAQPFFFMQVKGGNNLTTNTVYNLNNKANTVYIVSDDFEPGLDDEDTIATSMTVNGVKWANIMGDNQVRFLGFVTASRLPAPGTTEIMDPVAIFSPAVDSAMDVLDLLTWTV